MSLSTGLHTFDWLDTRSAARAKAGLSRTLRPRPEVATVLDLASNDYLGLTRDPRVTKAAADAALRWGAGATGSRLVTGTTELHAELEAELAEFCGFPSALVFSTGYAANLGVIAALSGPGTVLITDAHNHASLIDGGRLSRAETVVVPHRDVTAFRDALANRTRKRALVVTDSVFSVDGDLAPLAELAAACRDHGAGLVVDDAHGLGVLGAGEGAAAAAGLAGAPDVVVTTTLSKSFGAQGGAVLASERVIAHLIDTARSFIFDTGLAPSAVGAALAALRIIRADPALPGRSRAVARELAQRLTEAGLSASAPEAAVVSVRAPSPAEALEWSLRCRAEGVAVGCFRPPSVPDRVSRLRLTARADLTPAEITTAVAVILSSNPASGI
ncbi:8-amino-7-oxononanoate synthase [Allokutzneria sp. NRRL B-24872]|uniref:8-amino-7-oxononanoate synthase n=1 Tax=Allokutzneria sp. NRRL B-24872 TaxID=1137961 RepID=UPI001FEFE255|nr:8-amino-7-oxononanoate synthase [Allokutzneria sp. NRRL B-24872]